MPTGIPAYGLVIIFDYRIAVLYLLCMAIKLGTNADETMITEVYDRMAPELKTLKHDMEEHQNKVLMSMSAPSGKTVTVWRPLGEPPRKVTEEEEAEQIEFDRIRAEARKKIRNSAEYLDTCTSVVDPDRERIVIGDEIYVIEYGFYYLSNPPKCKVLVFENKDDGVLIRQESISVYRIEDLRNRRTEQGSEVYKNECRHHSI